MINPGEHKVFRGFTYEQAHRLGSGGPWGRVLSVSLSRVSRLLQGGVNTRDGGFAKPPDLQQLFVSTRLEPCDRSDAAVPQAQLHRLCQLQVPYTCRLIEFSCLARIAMRRNAPRHYDLASRPAGELTLSWRLCRFYRVTQLCCFSAVLGAIACE